MKIIFISIAALFFSCNEQTQSKNKLANKDSSANEFPGEGEFLSSIWMIRVGDSIYYLESSNSKAYPYINKDSVIYLPKPIGILRKIKVVKDTLFFLNGQGSIVKAYKREDSLELPAKSIKSGLLKLIDSTEKNY